MVDGYESEREHRARLSSERKRSTRMAELIRRETLAAVREVLPGALERLHAIPPDCMIEVMGWRVWRRNPVTRRCVPGWFIGTGRFEWRDSPNLYPMRVGYAIGNDGRLYVGRGVGDRRAFKTNVPEFQFRQFDQLTTEAVQDLLDCLKGAGSP